MNERVKTLVHERKISKLQIGDLESQIQDLVSAFLFEV